jgi:hypothetical protein
MWRRRREILRRRCGVYRCNSYFTSALLTLLAPLLIVAAIFLFFWVRRLCESLNRFE